MDETDLPEKSRQGAAWLRPDLAWSLALFSAALAAVLLLGAREGFLASGYGAGTALFFLLFGLFTIQTGFPHPSFGHVSFDRVAQVSSLLVLGPVDAAWINGLASLLWPWQRLWRGVPLPEVLTASLHNAGLMTLVILSCGLLYTMLGGPVPLESIDLRTAGLLLLLLVCMQLVNDAGMLVLLFLRRLDPRSLLSVFTSAVELTAGVMAVLVAIVYVSMDRPVFVLLLAVLAVGMFVLNRFALMRDRLERLVEERTEELRRKSIELERQATHDKLTGLYNRRFADDFLQREIENAERGGRELAIALADIDHFKRINDGHSHAVGDEVLRRVARLLVKRCRKTDVVARYGGEEFLLCFPDTSPGFAREICEQIRHAIETMSWGTLGDAVPPDFRITISFGVAAAGEETRRAGILGIADRRLYEAKKAGRNRVVG